MKNKAIVWFRNDLRVHDNEALSEALGVADEVIPVFVFDERIFKSKTSFGFDKTGVHRARFIIESVEDLRSKLRTLGSELVVKQGLAEDVIFDIATETKAAWVFCNRERTQEEVDIQDALEKKLWSKGQEIRFCRGKMLYYTADLPFPISHTPDTFSAFRKEVEKYIPIREPLATPDSIAHFTDPIELGEMPTVEHFGHKKSETNTSSNFKGGETAALEQLHYYIWESNQIATYKETRNGMLGWEFSSKMSAYLAHGCISPKKIRSEVLKYENERTKNDSTYWLIFELLWRDYFRLIGKKYCNKIFQPNGTSGTETNSLNTDREKFDLWANGTTGIPMIDANMRELKATGFMSNRGRQNVASFLINDMEINWLMGAEYFESLLIDYDPCSNYGNWNYLAGVGVDSRSDRWFNVVHQAKRYDEDGAFAHFWLPELKAIEGVKVHEIPLMDRDEIERYGIELGKDYPKAIVTNPRWA